MKTTVKYLLFFYQKLMPKIITQAVKLCFFLSQSIK